VRLAIEIAKPFFAVPRLPTCEERRRNMLEWSFSSTAELVVGLALALAVVALIFV
jgi:F0F1-type ATP synthase membrane subunit a